MKRLLTPAATFNPSAGTLDLSSIPSFDIRRLVAVIDLKTGTLVYAPVAGSGASSVGGAGVLTLQASVSSLNASDPLFVLYDDSTGKVAEDASVQAVTAAIQALITDLQNNHADLQAIHADAGTTLHADLGAILTKLGASPAQSSDVQAVKTALGTPAQSADVQAVTAKLGTPAQSSDVQAVVSKLANPAQSSDVAAVKSALGAAPAQTPDIQALGVLLQSVLTAIQNQRTESLWTDNSGAYYVRIDIPGASAPTWTTYTGAASAAPGAGARPAAGTDFITTSDTYRALNTASGSSPAYNAGDLLKHIETFNPNTGASVGQFWANINQNTTPAASAITNTDLQLLDPLAEGAATLAAQLAGNASLATTVSTLASILTATSTNHADLVTLHTDLNATLNSDLQAILAGIGTPNDAATLTSQIGLLKALIVLVGAKGDVASAGTALGLLAGVKSDLDTGLGNDTTALAAIAPTQAWQANVLALWQAIQAILGQAKTTGTLTASGATVQLPYTGSNGTGTIKLSGTWAGTVAAWGTVDGLVYDFPLMMVPAANPPVAAVSSATANGDYYVDLSGCIGFEVLMSPFTSGSCAVALAATGGSRRMRIVAPAADPAYVAPGTGALFPVAGLVAAADPAVAVGVTAEASFTTGGRFRVDTPNYGIGVSAPLPTLANAYGTPVGTPPTPCKGISIFVPPGGSVTYSIQALGTSYTSASPLASSLQNVFSNPTTMPMWLDEEFNGASLNLYLAAVTNGSATSGNTAPTFRWK